MPTPNLIEIHEDRIQCLEEGVTECRVDLGVLKSQLSDGFAMLSEKMDSLSDLKKRLEEIELQERVRSRLVKIGMVVLTGVAGVVGFIIKLVVGG